MKMPHCTNENNWVWKRLSKLPKITLLISHRVRIPAKADSKVHVSATYCYLRTDREARHEVDWETVPKNTDKWRMGLKNYQAQSIQEKLGGHSTETSHQILIWNVPNFDLKCQSFKVISLIF